MLVCKGVPYFLVLLSWFRVDPEEPVEGMACWSEVDEHSLVVQLNSRMSKS